MTLIVKKFPEDIHWALKALATEKRMSLKALVIEMAKEVVGASQKQKSK
jgi:hypothetical protein